MHHGQSGADHEQCPTATHPSENCCRSKRCSWFSAPRALFTRLDAHCTPMHTRKCDSDLILALLKTPRLGQAAAARAGHCGVAYGREPGAQVQTCARLGAKPKPRSWQLEDSAGVRLLNDATGAMCLRPGCLLLSAAAGERLSLADGLQRIH